MTTRIDFNNETKARVEFVDIKAGEWFVHASSYDDPGRFDDDGDPMWDVNLYRKTGAFDSICITKNKPVSFKDEPNTAVYRVDVTISATVHK